MSSHDIDEVADAGGLYHGHAQRLSQYSHPTMTLQTNPSMILIAPGVVGASQPLPGAPGFGGNLPAVPDSAMSNPGGYQDVESPPYYPSRSFRSTPSTLRDRGNGIATPMATAPYTPTMRGSGRFARDGTEEEDDGDNEMSENHVASYNSPPSVSSQANSNAIDDANDEEPCRIPPSATYAESVVLKQSYGSIQEFQEAQLRTVLDQPLKYRTDLDPTFPQSLPQAKARVRELIAAMTYTGPDVNVKIKIPNTEDFRDSQAVKKIKKMTEENGGLDFLETAAWAMMFNAMELQKGRTLLGAHHNLETEVYHSFEERWVQVLRCAHYDKNAVKSQTDAPHVVRLIARPSRERATRKSNKALNDVRGDQVKFAQVNGVGCPSRKKKVPKVTKPGRKNTTTKGTAARKTQFYAHQTPKSFGEFAVDHTYNISAGRYNGGMDLCMGGRQTQSQSQPSAGMTEALGGAWSSHQSFSNAGPQAYVANGTSTPAAGNSSPGSRPFTSHYAATSAGYMDANQSPIDLDLENDDPSQPRNI